jgi:hypothetical protein
MLDKCKIVVLISIGLSNAAVQHRPSSLQMGVWSAGGGLQCMQVRLSAAARGGRIHTRLGCREVLFEERGGEVEVTGLRLTRAGREEVAHADAYIAALDVPGAAPRAPARRRAPLVAMRRLCFGVCRSGGWLGVCGVEAGLEWRLACRGGWLGGQLWAGGWEGLQQAPAPPTLTAAMGRPRARRRPAAHPAGLAALPALRQRIQAGRRARHHGAAALPRLGHGAGGRRRRARPDAGASTLLASE